MFTRRQLIAAGLTVPVGVVLGTGRADAGRSIIIQDQTVREFGPVLFISDSTSSRLYRSVRRTMREFNLGPYRIDYLPGRSIARYRRGYPSGAAAVRQSRAAGFDPPAYLIALGANDLRYATTSKAQFDELVDKLLGEIGPDRVVGFLNIYATVRSNAAVFNRYLGEATTRWPNLHVIDWATLARRNRRWHLPDGFHYTITGARRRNEFLCRAMIQLIEITRAQNPDPPPSSTA